MGGSQPPARLSRLEQVNGLPPVLDPLVKASRPEPAPGQQVVRPADRRLVSGPARLLDRPPGVPIRLRVVPQVAVRVAQPEVVRRRQRGIAKPLHPLPLPEQEVQRLREAAQEVERARLAERHVEDRPILRLGSQPLRVPGGLRERPHGLAVGVAGGSLVGRPDEILDRLHAVVGPCVVIRKPLIYLGQALGVERLESYDRPRRGASGGGRRRGSRRPPPGSARA